jgi:PmbA protein
VRGVALAGNLFELLQGIDAVGSDLEWLGSIAAPTFRVRSVLVGGNAD